MQFLLTILRNYTLQLFPFRKQTKAKNKTFAATILIN